MSETGIERQTISATRCKKGANRSQMSDPDSNPSDADPCKRRIAYSETEDAAIVCFLIERHGLDLVKGNSVWKEAADWKSDPVRSWQSLRNRFWKNIVPNIRKYQHLTQEQQQQVLHFCSTGNEDQRDRQRVRSRSPGSATRSNDPYLCFLRHLEQKQQSVRRRSDSRPDPDTGSESSASDTGRRYSAAEDETIIQYIVKRIEWSKRTGQVIRLRGSQFWQEMSVASRINRSPQSLRERFLKRILPQVSDMLSHQPELADQIQKLASAKS